MLSPAPFYSSAIGDDRRRAIGLLAILLVISAISAPSSAQLSPGKLSQTHAEIDSSGDCLQCHATGQGVSAELCLTCHTLLGERIRAGAGLHARPDYQSCETCHIEHHGREFELIYWGKEGIEGLTAGEQAKIFDHDDTGYPLVGAHQVECRECHQASMILEPALLTAAGKDLDRTFLGLGTECASCHQDPHRGQMAPRACNECHGEETWTPADGFDHDDTAFPLDGGHLQAECADCHATETDADGSWVVYGGTPTACADCHEDPHRGRLGRDCAACHTNADWQTVDRDRFNHDLTRFPLRGLHIGVECASCHQGAAEGGAPSASFRIAGYDDCATCHADIHVGQFRDREAGSACSDCHDVNGFVPSLFDLDDHAETRFPLDGAHETVPCVSCHLEVATAELVARGVAVASPDMPLTAQDFRIEATECADCHRDPHAGTADAYFGDAGCMSCHDGEDWTSVSLAPVPGIERFNHSATGFELEGAHRTVGCSECHGAVTSAPASGDSNGSSDVLLSFEGAPTTCRGCHEDPHLGQFDTPDGQKACRDCHSMEGWSPSIFDHNRDSVFPLEGAHARAECSACHFLETIGGQDVVRYKPLPTACSGCHTNPDPSAPEAGPVSEEAAR